MAYFVEKLEIQRRKNFSPSWFLSRVRFNSCVWANVMLSVDISVTSYAPSCLKAKKLAIGAKNVSLPSETEFFNRIGRFRKFRHTLSQQFPAFASAWLLAQLSGPVRFVMTPQAVEMNGCFVAWHNVIAIRQMRTKQFMAYGLHPDTDNGIHNVWVHYRWVLRCCHADGLITDAGR